MISLRLLITCVFWAVAGLGAGAQTLSPLATPPDWARLEAFQQTITRDEFRRLLDEIYAPAEAWKTSIQIDADVAIIQTGAATPFTLRFANSAAATKPVPRFWKPATRLRGLRIALDPGHLGGRWAKMEERWFQIGAAKPVAEGDLTLTVARLLATRLRTLGAEVSFIRHNDTPLTRLRPSNLRAAAEAVLLKNGVPSPRPFYQGYADPDKASSIAWQSELLFYRTAEIHARAQSVNQRIEPDLVLCLHFNAEKWGDPSQPELVDKSHLHLLVNGCYSAAELALDDVRFEMLLKLLNRTADEELALSRAVATSLARATGLPPYVYHGSNAQPDPASPYVWTRNLLASRLYTCPVLYIEPYVMNSRADYARLQLGDYAGVQTVDGRAVPSIFREYADAVAAGLQAALGYSSSPLDSQEKVPK